LLAAGNQRYANQNQGTAYEHTAVLPLRLRGTLPHETRAKSRWRSLENRAGAPLEHAGGYLLVTHDGTKPVFSAIAR
jgi:hypothetical protein